MMRLPELSATLTSSRTFSEATERGDRIKSAHAIPDRRFDGAVPELARQDIELIDPYRTTSEPKIGRETQGEFLVGPRIA